MTIAVIGVCTVFFCLFLLFGVYSLTGWLFTRKASDRKENVQVEDTAVDESREEMVLTIDRSANSSNWNPASAKVGVQATAAAPVAHSLRMAVVEDGQTEVHAGPVADPRLITSPLPGTVISIDVARGDKVSKGQKVAVIEAMKMENDILATKDGVIGKICAAKGDTLLEGATIMEFES